MRGFNTLLQKQEEMKKRIFSEGSPVYEYKVARKQKTTRVKRTFIKENIVFIVYRYKISHSLIDGKPFEDATHKEVTYVGRASNTMLFIYEMLELYGNEVEIFPCEDEEGALNFERRLKYYFFEKRLNEKFDYYE